MLDARSKLNFIVGAACAVGCCLAVTAVANGFRSAASAILTEATFQQRRSAVPFTSREPRVPSGANFYVGGLSRVNHE